MNLIRKRGSQRYLADSKDWPLQGPPHVAVEQVEEGCGKPLPQERPAHYSRRQEASYEKNPISQSYFHLKHSVQTNNST